MLSLQLRFIFIGIVIGLASHFLRRPTTLPISAWSKTFNHLAPHSAPHFPNYVHDQPAHTDLSPLQARKMAERATTRTTSNGRLPAYFLSHGSPFTMFQPDSGPYKSWQRIGSEITSLSPQPEGIVFVSAHWESDSSDILVTQQSQADQDKLLYDYYNFPRHFYDVQFSSVASPELSQLVISTLKDAGISARGVKRGLDHGLFVPCRVAFGDKTSLPFVQVSLPQSDAPARSIELGRALAPLRDQGYLVMAGGMVVHALNDLRKAGWTEATKLYGYEKPFTRSVSRMLSSYTGGDRERAALELTHSPHFSKSHPTLEHILPLYVMLGAAGSDEAEILFEEIGTSLAYVDARFDQPHSQIH